MKIPFKTLFLSSWLLIYLSVAQIAAGQLVLCFGQDGHIAIESVDCECNTACPDEQFATETCSAADHCGPCNDVTPTTDTLRTSHQERQLRLFLPLTSFYTPYQSVYLSSLIQFQSMFQPRPSIHPAVRTTILLI